MMTRSRSARWRWHSKSVSGLIIKTAKHSLTVVPCRLTAAGNLCKFHWLFYRTRMQIRLTDGLRVLRLCDAYCIVSHRSDVTSENLSRLSFGEFGWKRWERCSCHTGCTSTPRLHNYDTGDIFFIKDSLKGRLTCEDTGFSFVFLPLSQWLLHDPNKMMSVCFSQVLQTIIRARVSDLSWFWWFMKH